MIESKNVNGSKEMFEMKMGEGCGPLRRDWRSNPPLSPLARAMLEHQSNCSLPALSWHLKRNYGLGSHVSMWSEALCMAMDHQVRIRSVNPNWLWMDQTYCNMTDAATRSPWLCYFPDVECLCDQEQQKDPIVYEVNKYGFGNTANGDCAGKYQETHQHVDAHNVTAIKAAVEAFRTAAMEYMFRTVSSLVIQEAQRQAGVVFGPNGAPEDLITVHVRWGDKSQEAKISPITDHINAVSKLLTEELDRRPDKNEKGNSSLPANIFLSTEDPEAVKAFVENAPPSWKIYHDVVVDELARFRPSGNQWNGASTMSINTRGRAGLVAMGSILLSLEANYFVLTTNSGYSRILNHLRKGIVDPRCGGCTRLVDLIPLVW